MVLWIIGGILLALGASGFTLLWWKLGDQWADDEYKKFGHGGGSPSSNAPKVIKSIDPDTAAGASPDQPDTDRAG